jgi:hypothetical protein
LKSVIFVSPLFGVVSFGALGTLSAAGVNGPVTAEAHGVKER